MGRARLAGMLLAASIAAGAAARDSEPGWDMVDELEAAVAACPAAQLPPGVRRSEQMMHAPRPSNIVHRQLELMLRADPSACPGVAAEAAGRLRVLVGEPERADVPVGFLALLRMAAEQGLGMARDEPFADRLGRIEWLLTYEAPSIPRWTEAQRSAWLVQPETLSLLQAFVARYPVPSRQTLMLAELRLRRDLPVYDPEAALRLFEQGMAYDRYADILSDGEHVRPDFRRAVAPMLRLDMFTGDDEDERALLRVGRRALAAARTREERGQALRILFAAALGDIDGSCSLVAEELQAFRDVPVVPLATGEDRRIFSELSPDFAPVLVSDEPRRPRPIVLRALIDPSGRVVYARVRQSSGSRDRDRAPVEAWAAHAEEVDLSATSRGRFVWADLPPIPPMPVTTLDEAGAAPNTPGPC